MKPQNFFLISSDRPQDLPNNKRNSFKNILPTPISSVGKIALTPEKVFFESNFSYYISEIDDIYYYLYDTQNVWRTERKIFTLKDLTQDIQFFFNNLRGAKIEILHGNKIALNLQKGLVLFSRKLFNFLKIQNTSMREHIVNGEVYFLLHDHQMGVVNCISYEGIHLNQTHPEFIEISCDEIENFFSPRNCKTIATIQIEEKQKSYFHEPPSKKIFLVNKPYLSEFNIKFLHPNGMQIFFDKGTPTIVKMSMKKFQAEDFFYVKVTNEKNDLFPNNSFTEFSMDLQSEKILEGEWGVSLVNSFLPRPRNFLLLDEKEYVSPATHNYILLYWGDTFIETFFPLIKFTKKDIAMFIAKTFEKELEIYMTEKENLRFFPRKGGGVTTACLMFYSITLAKTINDGFYKENLSLQNRKTHTRAREILQKAQKYDYSGLSHMEIPLARLEPEKIQDSLCYFPLEDFYNSKIFLPDTMDKERLLQIRNADFKRELEKKLLVYLSRMYMPQEQEFLPPFFFLYADFVKETSMGGKFANILKMLPYKTNYDESTPGGVYSPSEEEFYIVKQTRLKTLHFNLRTHSGHKYKFVNEDSLVMLTLKFQKLSHSI